MNKTLQTIGIIVSVVVLGIGGWFLMSKNQKKINKSADIIKEAQKETKQNVIPEKSGIQNEQNSETISQNNQDNTGENLMFKKFTPAEAEKLRKEKDLVWYEIPELGIKFLVRKDELKDLEYTIEGVSSMDNHGMVYFSSASVVNFFKQKNIKGDFTQWGLLKTDKNELDNPDVFSRLIYHNEEYNIYYIPQRQAPVFSSDTEIREYEDYLAKKGLQSNENAIYLGTIKLK